MPALTPTKFSVSMQVKPQNCSKKRSRKQLVLGFRAAHANRTDAVSEFAGTHPKEPGEGCHSAPHGVILMFCLKVIYLMGRSYAAPPEEGDDKRTAEWPPHPGRLFCALVAAWGESGGSDEGRKVIEWLEHRTILQNVIEHHPLSFPARIRRARSLQPMFLPMM